MSTPRERLAAAIRAARFPVENPTAESVIDNVVDSILAASADGEWIVWKGEVRQVDIADRFGPSSWEITTSKTEQDRAEWDRWLNGPE